MNYSRIALAALGATVTYFLLGGILFAVLPTLQKEFMKYPAVYRTKDDMKRVMPMGMISCNGSRWELSSASFTRRRRFLELRKTTGGKGMAKITGIGGVFFKSRNKGGELASWYQKNLGLDLESWGGAILRWPDDKAGDGGCTVWSAADHDTKWFSPSESSFMINYRVDNLDELLDQLKQNGVEIESGPQSDENGKFAWIMDLDGNKVELWEPTIPDEKNKSA